MSIKNKPNYVLALLLILVLFEMMCCNRPRSEKAQGMDGMLITKAGSYKIDRLQYEIHVTVDANNIFHYAIVDDSRRKIIGSTESPSVFQRWCLFWDEKDRFWVWSSDIGGFVWEKDLSGIYREHDIIEGSEYIKEMPPKVFEFLPSSVKKKWNAYRDVIG